MSTTVVTALSRFLDKRTSRRGFLMRLAVVGSAVAVGPVRYLLEPDSAWAVTCGSGGCGSGSLCCDGESEFCCTLVGSNCCPAYTFVSGWWKCAPYSGSGYCSSARQRYYLDCARASGHSCRGTGGTCACGDGSCNCRITCCNLFTYCNANLSLQSCNSGNHGGQYSPHEVVCRIITCSNPCGLTSDGCGHSFHATCGGVYDYESCTQQGCHGCTE